jgi:hypothetical protein
MSRSIGAASIKELGMEVFEPSWMPGPQTTKRELVSSMEAVAFPAVMHGSIRVNVPGQRCEP